MHYKFSYDNPNTHLIHVTLSIDNVDQETVKLHLPAWRPGRYEIANFSKNILALKVLNENAKALKFEKTSKDSWLVQTGSCESIQVHYTYYAFAMDAGNSWLDENQLYLNFINCAIYTKEHLGHPCTIELDIPEDYQCATGLQSTGKHCFSAPTYYQLVDSPLIASDSLRRIQYAVKGHEFNVWIQGELSKTDEDIIDDFERFTQKQIAVMGEFPCPDYHFLFQCLPYQHYHGVEHFNSTTITIGPSDELADRARYKKLLGVSCHELFHTWNVIRLRPKEMVPYDFKKENYHKTGFITEGVTTYYGDLFLVRSGVFSVEEYLEELNGMLKRHFENEGRRNMSVAHSSYDLWLDGYEKGVPGRKVSIYNEGALAALILDLTIRLKWNHKRGLDDVMRLMWERHGRDCSGYSKENYINAAEEIYGDSLDDYFNDYIFGTAPVELALKPLLTSCGLGFDLVESEKTEERQFGFRLAGSGVIQIATGSPAATSLSLKDKIIKVNGQDFEENQGFDQKAELEIDRFSVVKKINLSTTNETFFQVYQITINQIGNNNLVQWLIN